MMMGMSRETDVLQRLFALARGERDGPPDDWDRFMDEQAKDLEFVEAFLAATIHAGITACGHLRDMAGWYTDE